MTVAAIILVPDNAAALGNADGEPAVRRVAHAAWSGGALPIVIVADETAPLAEALSGLPVTLHEAGSVAPGVAWLASGLAAATKAVTETTAGLLWPFRYTWVDPETVTSLVEAHGATPTSIIRPSYAGAPGLPILIPAALAERLAALAPRHGVEAVDALIAQGVPVRILELGDPGIVYDMATPRADLPEYQGPPQPEGAAVYEWNEELATHAERSGEPAR
ncbi:MAG TPA: NTP transferase domain-containing protein [Candidatus Limnocylindrales bacterium]